MARISIAMERPGHEAIRVVPLHQPKIRVALGADQSELWQSIPRHDLKGVKLKYFGGPLLSNVEVFVIYWGSQFTQGKLLGYPDRLDAFFDTILDSPLMDQMSEYSVKGHSIGRGRRIGSTIISTAAPKSHISDSALRTQLSKWIDAKKAVPAPTANALYFVFTEPGITVSMGGSKSCSSFCGYHDAIGSSIYYAVMPFPSCSGCLGEMSAFDALCVTASHELCEAVTDPIPGSSWYNEQYGEVGDICAWQYRKYQGYLIQKEWSNKAGKCV